MTRLEGVSPLGNGMSLRTRERIVAVHRRMSGEIALAVGDAPDSKGGLSELPFFRGLMAWRYSSDAEIDWASSMVDEDNAQLERAEEEAAQQQLSLSSPPPEPMMTLEHEGDRERKPDVLMPPKLRPTSSALRYVIMTVLIPQVLAAVVTQLLGLNLPAFSFAFQMWLVVTTISAWSLYLTIIGLTEFGQQVFQMNSVMKKVLWLAPEPGPPTIQALRDRAAWHPRNNAWLIFMTTLLLAIAAFAVSKGLPSLGGGWLLHHVVLFVVRVVLFPFCVAIVDEIQRALVRLGHGPVAVILLAPLILFDRITSREPDNVHLDLGVTALRELKRLEGVE
jgi:uncharacterized protein YqhQ